jgi:hypothetical protein
VRPAAEGAEGLVWEALESALQLIRVRLLMSRCVSAVACGALPCPCPCPSAARPHLADREFFISGESYAVRISSRGTRRNCGSRVELRRGGVALLHARPVPHQTRRLRLLLGSFCSCSLRVTTHLLLPSACTRHQSWVRGRPST